MTIVSMFTCPLSSSGSEFSANGFGRCFVHRPSEIMLQMFSTVHPGTLNEHYAASCPSHLAVYQQAVNLAIMSA